MTPLSCSRGKSTDALGSLPWHRPLVGRAPEQAGNQNVAGPRDTEKGENCPPIFFDGRGGIQTKNQIPFFFGNLDPIFFGNGGGVKRDCLTPFFLDVSAH